MIECFKIEEFVIDQLFRPYMSNLLPGDLQETEFKEQNQIEKKLRKTPEYIIELLEEYPETKALIFGRISRCGGVKFYRYLDMDCDVIQYVQSELPKFDKMRIVEMVKQLREETGYGMMDCKRAIIKANYDMGKAIEMLRNKRQGIMI